MREFLKQNTHAPQQRICILDYGDLKSIESSSLLKQINQRLGEIEFQIAIINFSSQFKDVQRFTDHVLNSKYLEMISIGEPPLTLIFTEAIWRSVARFDETLPLPTALENFAQQAVSLRQFEIISLASVREGAGRFAN